MSNRTKNTRLGWFRQTLFLRASRTSSSGGRPETITRSIILDRNKKVIRSYFYDLQVEIKASGSCAE